MPSRKKSIDDHEVETQEESISTAYWMGQVDTTLKGLRESFEQFAEMDKQNWMDERSWRGTISVAINGLDKRLFLLEQNSKLKQLSEKSSDNSDESTDQTIEKKAITWRWIIDKLAAPVLVAIVIFLLLNFIPQIISHLAAASP